MNLSRLLTMMSNLGRFPRSFCQQSSISWWRASGQSCQNQHNTISQANSLSGLTVPYQQRQLIEHEFYIKGTKYCLHSLSSYRMVDHDINFAKGKIKENSNKVLAYIFHYLFHENHHLYQIYNKKMKLSTYHWWWESVPPVYGPDDVLIGPVPIWPLSIGDHLPHDNSVTPHVTGRRKLPERYGFWCCPSHRNFSTLHTNLKNINLVRMIILQLIDISIKNFWITRICHQEI